MSIFQHVANDTNAYELEHKLAGLYERKNALNKASLMRKLVMLKYIDGDSIVVHTNIFDMGLVNQLASTMSSRLCYYFCPYQTCGKLLLCH